MRSFRLSFLAPKPHVAQQEQDGVAERGGAQTVPIKSRTLGAQPELRGQFGEPRNGQGISLDEVAAPDGADFGIDPVLRAEAKETSERRLARDDIAGGDAIRCI